MNYFIEPSKKIPVKAEIDVLVIGAGPAGFSAAVNAARQGAITMLIDQAGDVGGVATTGMMSHWTGDTKGGFFEEILDRSSDLTTNTEPQDINRNYRQIINTEQLKTVMLEMLIEAGVDLQLYTFASEAIVENNCIKGIIVESKSGREAIFAKIVIDASGDGDIAAKAGATYNIGRETDGKMQPVTIMFKSNYRVMPICANMGQAIGIAAALCAKENILPRKLDVKKLQQILKEQGVYPQ